MQHTIQAAAVYIVSQRMWHQKDKYCEENHLEYSIEEQIRETEPPTK